MAEFRIVIPFPGGNQVEADKGHGYHGILRLVNVQEDTPLPAPGARQGRPLAVFNHGLLADKNALFFQSLASELPIDSFRWDACGEGQTPGDWRYSKYNECAEDLFHVVDYLHRRFGYFTDLMINHSKGCAVSAVYISRYCNPGPLYKHRSPSRVIFACGSVDMSLQRRKDAEFQPFFDSYGYVPMRANVGDLIIERRIHPEDHASMRSFPAHIHYANIPPHVQCFIAHGSNDEDVSVENLGILSNILMSQVGRPAGSVVTQIYEKADHNLSHGAMDKFMDQVRSWLKKSEPSVLLSESIPIKNALNGKRGAFIVVEGLDRSGKSTQVARLVETLEARHVKFPERTTSIGMMINSYLTNRCDINDQAVHLLFSANRWEMLSSILQTLQRGQHVVCDRYAFSGMAYSHAKGLDLSWCISPDVGMPLPDITLFLDLDETTATKRAAYGEERYEKKAFQSLVREAFQNIALLMERSGARWERIDASGSPDEVWQAVHTRVQNAIADAQTSEHLRSLHFCFAALGMGMLHQIKTTATF